MNEIKLRQKIVLEARKWIGTQYMHQASQCGVGADCLGVVRGVWRECIGLEPEVTPAYSADWNEVSSKETMLNAAQKWFDPVDIKHAQAGDIILFRWKNSHCIKHVGILTGVDHFIHAYEKAGVVETHLGMHWRKRIVAAFRFPSKRKTGNK